MGKLYKRVLSLFKNKKCYSCKQRIKKVDFYGYDYHCESCDRYFFKNEVK